MTENDTEAAFAAFDRRDRSQDGAFVGAVKTTRIYCKPSCPARRPRRENVEFFDTGEQARAAGYRACLRCRPDEVARDAGAVAKARALMNRPDEHWPLAALAAAVGYAPHHFQRLFKREVGLSPAQYGRAIRSEAARTALAQSGSVTEAIYESGYSGPSRFYADSLRRLGMTPGAWKAGGAGVTIRWTIVETSLGAMLLAATDKGICRLSFDEGEAELRRHFPNAVIVPGDTAFEALVKAATEAVENPATMPALPLDIAGTAFQRAVWAELQRIPAGQTRTYAQIAAAIGKPKAVRAAGTANGQNRVAVLIPCHRVIGTDGSLRGYAYGIERKKALLDREHAGATPPPL